MRTRTADRTVFSRAGWLGRILVLPLYLALFAGCADHTVPGGAVYLPVAADIEGEWVVDKKAMRAQAGWNPLHQAAVKVIEQTKLRFAAGRLTATVLIFDEQREFSAAYRVVAVESNRLILAAADPTRQHEQWQVQFRSRDQIELDEIPGAAAETTAEQPADLQLIMRRVLVK